MKSSVEKQLEREQVAIGVVALVGMLLALTVFGFSFSWTPAIGAAPALALAAFFMHQRRVRHVPGEKERDGT